jgi:hypothetical protein
VFEIVSAKSSVRKLGSHPEMLNKKGKKIVDSSGVKLLYLPRSGSGVDKDAGAPIGFARIFIKHNVSMSRRIYS